MAAVARSLAGVEVPILGSDKAEWIEVTVPSSSFSFAAASAPQPSPLANGGAAFAPRDAAGCHAIEGVDTKSYLIWRLHKDSPNILEVVEVIASKEFPQTGLHLVFQDALCPSAFLCKNVINSGSGNAYLLYVLTVSGVAYLLSLRSPFSYISGSSFPQREYVEFNVAPPTQITAMTAAAGCLVTGRQDGVVSCFQLGILDPSSPGFATELRDDVGIGRLWNLMSRQKAIGAVQDMVISDVCKRKCLFVIHADGLLRVWDLVSHNRVVSYNTSSHELEGTKPSRLWVNEANYDANLIYLAILHDGVPLSDIEMVAVYHFGLGTGDKLLLSPQPSSQSIHLDEGKLIDLKFEYDKLWILKGDGSMLYDLSQTDFDMKHTVAYGLQEDFVADQLFQSSEHALDDLMWTDHSIFSSVKDQAAYLVSSLYLRRLLQPGVYQSTALRATLLEHKKYISDYEFQSLTMDGLKKEIFAIIEGEGAATNSTTTVYYWRSFCTHFLRHWCQNSTPYGFFVDSSQNVVGLIRKNSVSLFRSLEGIEQLIYGFSDEFNYMKSSGMSLQDNVIDPEVLFEVLRCMSHISHQLGPAASALYYESLINPSISSEDIMSQLLKILEAGYCPSVISLIQQIGVDAAWEKKQTAHRSQRKFAVDILVSLNLLCSKATNWLVVLDTIEKFLTYLNPHRSVQEIDSKCMCNINSILLVQATSQVARMMFEAAFDLLLLLGYLVNISGQVNLLQTDIVRIKVRLIPTIYEVITKWLIIHFMGTTPTTRPTIEDFSSRLSLLHIGNRTGRNSWDGKLGSSDFTLACLFEFPTTFEGLEFLCSTSLPNPSKLNHLVQKYCSLIACSLTVAESNLSPSPTIELASLLLHHGQYEAAESLFIIVDGYSRSKKVSISAQTTDGEWCAHLHLLGFCLLVRAQSELQGVLKEQKLHEAVRCFFRAASGREAPKYLQNLRFETGFQHPEECASAAIWRLHYYQWAMQIFEQYGVSEGACQFALAALEQVDEVLNSSDNDLTENETTIRGRLWANVFKFTLDLKHYHDAYCAIISNPDEESKYICFRRFVIVLCENRAAKVLCDGGLPFVGLIEKVEQELVWKAERSDIFAKPNPYKLLYAFEANRNNWRKAACYMFRYSVRLKKEANSNGNHQDSSVLQERLHALSAAINALQQVDHAYAWIESQYGNDLSNYQGSPNKKPRNVSAENFAGGLAPESSAINYSIDIDMLEKEYIITSAHHMLSLVNNKMKFPGIQKLSNVVDVLIEENLYDMAFTIVVNFWKGSGLKRELEQAFVALSQKCCPNRVGSAFMGSNVKTNNLLLTYSEEETPADSKKTASPVFSKFKGNDQWETLELYLEKYRKLDPRLPVTVAETLLYTDPQIELPLWLVHMFKGGRKVSWGMTGQEPDSATLFRLYVDYGRHAEATNLLLENLDSFSSLRPADIINRKKMSATWFPYIAIERLWCQLEEMRSSGHMVDHCDKLKKLLQEALMKLLKQVQLDSDDALAAAAASKMQNPGS
uniref:Nuclear pore complex protein NUP160 domain-containing protein n=1 Tax=Musa acuminata subsp. malaccensis TaxID=214687 RepID=A0A804KJ75_MUSAM|nr:PREDICTED: nuclear pore complex protein NUP160 [Musa acuminata subsp. malaccensis]XP_018674063.1 PREDICTED: nuclear pore complex protein NUP160 [Musa acuminata subsp. malaccensis]